MNSPIINDVEFDRHGNTLRLCIGDHLNRWFKWYDAEGGSAELWENIRKDAPSHLEEFTIVDHEYFTVNPLTLGITKAADFAEFVAGFHSPSALLHYVSIIGPDVVGRMAWEYEEEVSYFVDEERFRSVTRYDFDELEDKFNEAYRGSFASAPVFARHWYEELGHLNGDGAKKLAPYVDWEAVARDLSQDINFVESDGGVYAFWNH